MPFEDVHNATYRFPSGHPTNMSLPVDPLTGGWSQCSRLDANFTDEYFASNIPATKVVPCDDWVFDHSKYLSSAVFEVISLYSLIANDVVCLLHRVLNQQFCYQ
jgi:hypothetical protein